MNTEAITGVRVIIDEVMRKTNEQISNQLRNNYIIIGIFFVLILIIIYILIVSKIKTITTENKINELKKMNQKYYNKMIEATKNIRIQEIPYENTYNQRFRPQITNNWERSELWSEATNPSRAMGKAKRSPYKLLN